MPRHSAAFLARQERSFLFVCRALTPLIGRDLPSCDDVDWEQVVRISNLHLVAPALGWTLRDRINDPEIKDYFAAVLTLNELRNATFYSALSPLLSALHKVGAEPILMKGAAALADRLYPAQGVRFLGDIDILVEDDCIIEAARSLEDLGYSALQETSEAGFVKTRAIESHHHVPMMFHEGIGVGVELHRAVLRSPFDRFLPAVTCYRRCERGVIEGVVYHTLHPTDRVILNIVHDQLHHEQQTLGRTNLRQLLELAAIDNQNRERLDWDEIQATFRLNGHSAILESQAYLSEILLGWRLPIPQSERPRAALALLTRRLSFWTLVTFRIRQYKTLLLDHPLFALNFFHPVWLALRAKNLTRMISRYRRR